MYSFLCQLNIELKHKVILRSKCYQTILYCELYMLVVILCLEHYFLFTSHELRRRRI